MKHLCSEDLIFEFINHTNRVFILVINQIHAQNFVLQ